MIASISLCSSGRLAHLEAQLAAVSDTSGVLPIVVWLGDDAPPAVDGVTVARVAPATGAAGFGPAGAFRLAAARNVGAALAIDAGADLLVFLDADCIPGPELFARYVSAAEEHSDAVLCGPVTYLPEGMTSVDAASLVAATAPHRARPNPPAGGVTIAAASDYALFWSLSFALTPDTWARAGGFHEAYVGYGGEDTDFAWTLRDRGIPLAWVGGAHAYHQYHPTSSPPWHNIDDIVRNAGLFFDRWGEWPMSGWLAAFQEAGAVDLVDGRWARVAR
ncbi:glycosyltransferase family 2 protein [Marisediminicola senii]|uniref:glycosyltransferase family 2 protein n=1 Tax=Marisediminicola senii TaxID=2711233 RepID=UPI0013EE01BD|nr:galactosyltransferase-related protein [Marisediminicola senii]